MGRQILNSQAVTSRKVLFPFFIGLGGLRNFFWHPKTETFPQSEMTLQKLQQVS